jgi:hypothetical protein
MARIYEFPLYHSAGSENMEAIRPALIMLVIFWLGFIMVCWRCF